MRQTTASTLRIAVGLALWLLVALASTAPAADELYDVDVTVTNTFQKDFTQLPVMLQVFRVFGRGVDYGKFNRNGFHVYNDKGDELEFYFRQVPPSFSIACSELVVVVPKFAAGAKLQLRFTNTAVNTKKEGKLDSALLLDNPNNLIPNGGFEKGVEGWEGGKLVSDVTHSGKNALLLEVPGGGGNAALHCSKPLSFTKGMNYYFGVWAKCENVVRHTWRHTQPWALQPDSGRISFSGDPLVFPEYDGNEKNHLIRLMDDRDWYCYEANALSTLCIPQPAVNTCQSTLTLNLNQENMPYLDAGKPARVWIDEVMLFEQPQVEINCDRISKKLMPNGLLIYRRAATCMNEALYALPQLEAPRPYEKIEKISDTSALGEHKIVTLGVYTTAPIQNMSLDLSDLKGPGGAALPSSSCEIEFDYTPSVNFKFNATSLEGWVIDGNTPRNIDRPGYVDFLLGYRIADNATPGKYSGTIKIKGNGKDLGEVPFEMEIVNLPLKVITDRLIGCSDNSMNSTDYRYAPGFDKSTGAAPFNRDATFYKYYSRTNFTYLMMFCRFLPFKGDNGTEVDIPTLVANVKTLRDVAGCTAGVGLYWDCTVDKCDGGHGLWSRSGKNQDAYRARAKEMDEAMAKAGLPHLVYMIWDEIRSCDPILGILKGTGAWSTSDINYRECCQQLQQGLISHASVDGPGCDYGPAYRKFAEKCGQKIGFDTHFGPFCHRYQTSFMMASGAATCSSWHVGYYMGYHQAHKACVRGQNIVGAAEGVTDFRYFETLKETIATAKKKGLAKKEVDAAEKYLKDVMDFCSDDFHFMGEIETFTYNGGPERWGDDWFYDRWRSEMRNHTLAILKAMGPLVADKK
jgi:hypothetical protein